MAVIIFYLGMVIYSVAATLFFVDLARKDGSVQAARLAPRVLLAGAVVHSAHVVVASLISHLCPIGSTPFALSLSGLMTVVAYLVLRRKSRLDAMGVVVAPLALTFLVVAQYVGSVQTQADPASGVLLQLHVLANLIGLGLFLLAGAASGFYLVQERRLKAKRALLGADRLPALDALDRTEHRLLLAGFPLLTFGIVTGGFFMTDLQMEPTIILRSALAYTTWALVALVLVLRAAVGWRGRKAAYGTLAGAACVLLVMFTYLLRSGGIAS